jgi:hypothetical protein
MNCLIMNRVNAKLLIINLLKKKVSALSLIEKWQLIYKICFIRINQDLKKDLIKLIIIFMLI